MINPTPDDIGRRVIYKLESFGAPGARDQGVITSYNDHMVFVRYGSDQGSMGTRRKDLHWASDGKAIADLITGSTSMTHRESFPLSDGDEVTA
jgi:hypothetical protein